MIKNVFVAVACSFLASIGAVLVSGHDFVWGWVGACLYYTIEKFA